MGATLRVIGRAIRLWWREVYILILFNIIWFALQLPIITGPAATAAMYAVARRIAHDEFIEPSHGWQAFRQMFWPALKWGGLSLVIVGAGVGNFWLYQGSSGAGWAILRITWGTIILGWVLLNLFYWPFWLNQDDRSIRTTLRNSIVFLTKRPGLGLSLALINIVLITASALVTLPLLTATMALVALIGIVAVEEELKAA